jgi:hypothetical protein
MLGPSGTSSEVFLVEKLEKGEKKRVQFPTFRGWKCRKIAIPRTSQRGRLSNKKTPLCGPAVANRTTKKDDCAFAKPNSIAAWGFGHFFKSARCVIQTSRDSL